MPKLKSVFWTLIRKESAPDQIDWGAVFTLTLYVLLVLLLVLGMALSFFGMFIIWD